MKRDKITEKKKVRFKNRPKDEDYDVRLYDGSDTMYSDEEE